MNTTPTTHKQNRVSLWFIVLTFVIALLLSIYPYPDWMEHVRPDWVAMVLFYWALMQPNRVSVGVGWTSGFVVDLFSYSILGQHAVGKAVLALITHVGHRRIRMYGMLQQCLLLALLVLIDLTFVIWINRIAHGTPIHLVMWQSVLSTTLLWPFIWLVLQYFNNRIHGK